MGLDSHIKFTADTAESAQEKASGEASSPGSIPAADLFRTATTASMQSLLAQYFESESFEPHKPDAVHFEATPGHALSNPQSETRPVKPEDTRLSPVAPSLQLVSAVAEPPPHPAVSQEWPVSARSLIDSLMSENEALREKLHRQGQQLLSAQDQADSDVLTPTLNRRAFLREVARAMADCKRYGEEACVLYLDMDGFKSINDAYGHAAGDAALIYVAQTLLASVREGDAVGRMGGDEFAVLLRRADLKSSRVKAMKLEAELMMGTFEHAGLYLKTGGSFGVRAYAGQPSAEAWVSEADAAMFLVKKSSR